MTLDLHIVDWYHISLMPIGVYERKPGHLSGRYERTPAIRKKMSDSHKQNPTKYWLGRSVPVEITEKIKATKRRNNKRGNADYFKTHKYVGKDHALWAGDNVGYYALHGWLYRHLGKPSVCEHCGRSGLSGRQIHWANKSGQYKRVKGDWLRLCAKCHYHYDRD